MEMIDREKVVKGLECCFGAMTDILCLECPYFGECKQDLLGGSHHMGTDAVELLKEQEAVEPRRIDGKRNHFIKCGNCNYDLMTGFQFCPHCGREVKWK